jgi:hypothetical protein
MILDLLQTPLFIYALILSLFVFAILYLWRKITGIENYMFILEKRINNIKKPLASPSNNKENDLINILLSYNSDLTIKEIELSLKIDKTVDFKLLSCKEKKKITKNIKNIYQESIDSLEATDKKILEEQLEDQIKDQLEEYH